MSTRKLRVNRCDASISALCLRLCLCLRRPGLRVRRKHNRMEPFPFSCACAYACVVSVNRDGISTSARKGNTSAMLGCLLARDLIPAARLRHIFMLLRLRMSPYAYRTCKHPCAYACVVRVNQA